MKKIILLTSLVIILSGCSSDSAQSTKTVSINNHTWTIEVVSTPEAQEQGLSNRKSLPADSGMYFIFNDAVERTFWMKNMKFPLDIIWLKDDEVVRVDYDAMPEGDNPQNFYYSKEAVNRVLEINNGEAMKYNIKPGDKLKINE